jgi:predicted secreted hydrolase
MVFRYLFIFYCIISFTFASYGQGWKSYPLNPEGSLISFPLDEGRHPAEPIEWWYTAGHVTGDNTGTSYSFMLTYFYFPAFGYDGFRILNVSNEETGAFYSETAAVNYSIIAEDSLNIQATTMGGNSEYWLNKTGSDDIMIPFEYILSAESGQNMLDLEYESLKPPLILGENGYFQQGESSYTYYYSLTKSLVKGTLSIDELAEPVSGTAWVDRQYGTFNPLTEEDYEWFYVQLSNDMDINIYNLFTQDRKLPDTATYKHMSVYVDTITQYTTHDFEIERLAFNYMPDSVMCYSSKWRLTSAANNIDLIIATNHNNSEIQLPFRFFEGSTHVTGTVNGEEVTGIGFAELLHSYEQPEIDITYPSSGSWTAARAISWEIKNPDDGRPIHYNLEYSIDQKETFLTLATGLSDQFYFWEEPEIPAGSLCWFRINAYSIDSTLINTVISDNASEYDPNLTPLDKDLSENGKEGVYQLYPNPAEDMIFLELNQKHPYLSYLIFDINGRTLRTQNIRATNRIQIDLKNLHKGIYFIGLKSGDDMVVSKFLVR